MFTGIIQEKARVVSIAREAELVTIRAAFPEEFLRGVSTGASIALSGCCLTVTSFTNGEATFDLVPETVARTSFKDVKEGDALNAERSLKFGDEVGGHIVSGHVDTTASILEIALLGHSRVVTFAVGKEWLKFLFEKGYVAINGASLTITNVNQSAGTFKVSLIPETLARTTFNELVTGAIVNIEVDKTTQSIVSTVERVLQERELSKSG
jgi:riboflavin synthase